MHFTSFKHVNTNFNFAQFWHKMKHYFAIFLKKLSRNYELRSRSPKKMVKEKRKKKKKKEDFFKTFFLFLLQNVDKICYCRHVICTDGRVTGNKTLFLFGLTKKYIPYCFQKSSRLWFEFNKLWFLFLSLSRLTFLLLESRSMMETVPEGMTIPSELEFKPSGMESEQIGKYLKVKWKIGTCIYW